MATVNILLSTYNGEKYIRNLLNSILNQTYKDFRIFICDDLSSDNTMNILREYEKKIPTKIYVFQNSVNKGSKRSFLELLTKVNKITSFEAEQYYMFCDQDDVWRRNKLELSLDAVTKLEKEYGADLPALIFTDAFVVNQDLKIINPSFYKQSKLDTNKTSLASLLMENKCIGATTCFNQALVDFIKIVPKYARMHDYYVALIASAFGKLAFLPEKTILYRQHGNNVIGGKKFVSYVIDRIMNLRTQRESIKEHFTQAKEFYKIYEEELDVESKKVLQRFIMIENQSFFEKRNNLKKYGFLKTGIVRNIGLFLLV